MSLPLEPHEPLDPLEGSLVDRLVDGELSEMERRALLLRFENEPDCWRRCALAFLEAQCWREAFAPLVTPTLAQTVRLPECPGPQRGVWGAAAILTGLAAALVLAFGLGWALHGVPGQIAVDRVAVKETTPVPDRVGEPAQAPPTSLVEQEPSRPTELPAALHPVIKRLEQRGYRAETQKRLVSLELQGGRRLNVPIQELRLHYIGSRTY